jgi:hypothetical protein
MQIPGVYKIVMKYVAPLYLIVVFLAFCVQNLGGWMQGVREEPLRQGALLLVAATTAALVVCTYLGERRWRAAGLDVDGRRPPSD